MVAQFSDPSRTYLQSKDTILGLIYKMWSPLTSYYRNIGRQKRVHPFHFHSLHKGRFTFPKSVKKIRRNPHLRVRAHITNSLNANLIG